MTVKNTSLHTLVTGGAGFIGSHLCEELLSRGLSVTAVDNFSTSRKSNISTLLKNKNFKFYKGSMNNRLLMQRLIRQSDVIYHMAAALGVKYILDHPLGSILTNIKGTEIVLELADTYRKKVILASTSEVYGKHSCEPSNENDDRVLGPTNVSRWSYAEAKAIDEFLALAYAKERKLSVVIVRFFNTVGPRQAGRYGMVLPRFIQQALAEKPITIYGDGQQLRSFIYVKDAVYAVAELSLKKEAVGQIFNIGNNQPVSMKDLASMVKEKTKSSSQIQFVSYEDVYKDKAMDFEDIECRIPDISRLKAMIRFEPAYDIDKIIEATVEYFRGLKGKQI